jgi:lipopolysaccharide biosynthesis protein
MLFDFLRVPVAWLQRNRNFVTATHVGGRSLTEAKNVAVFVHFDRRGEIHDYVLFYLRALLDVGFDILFVSNGPSLTPAALTRVSPLCVTVLCRKNVGYDFGAYREGLRLLGNLSRFQQVLLANDSVYGPLFDLRTILSRCNDEASVWGMTDGWSHRYHLQSYFLLIGQEALRAPRFMRFWNSLLPMQSKGWTIRRYEIGFTQTMLRAGLKCKALFPYRQAAADIAHAYNAGEFSDQTLEPHMQSFFEKVFRRVERGAPVNPMHEFWDHMIGGLRCPFIKRELLARNPARIPHVYLWERLIRSTSPYDTDLIVRHLQIVARDRAP